MVLARHPLIEKLLATASEVFWAGDPTLFVDGISNSQIYERSFDYRLPDSHHQRFDLVLLVDRDLAILKAWPLIVDEALRLLAPGGVLVIRMKNSAFLSLFELKNIIFNWKHIVPHFEETQDDGTHLFAVRNVRQQRRRVDASTFSFGIITDGKRPTLLKSLVDSVQTLKATYGNDVELMVCGPKYLKSELGDEVTLIPEPDDFRNQAWITRKKNLLVQSAKHQNIVIAHDRYVIPADFIERVRQFGGDFSILVCRQLGDGGRRVPDWITLGSEWTFTRNATLEYGDWSPYLFVGGGIMIAKTHVLREVGWNELLFWNQAEDIELTRRLRGAGYIPRLARNVVVRTSLLRKAFKENFEAIPFIPDRYVLPGKIFPDVECINPTLSYDKLVEFGSDLRYQAERLGVYCSTEWQVEPRSICLPLRLDGEISFRLPGWPSGPVKINLSMDGPTLLQVIANDIPIIAEREMNNLYVVTIPKNVFALSQNVKMYFRHDESVLRISSLILQLPDDVLRVRGGKRLTFCSGGTGVAALGEGWSIPESHGCWSVTDRAEMTFYLSEVTSDLILDGEAVGFFRPSTIEKIVGVMVNGIAIGHFRIFANSGIQKFRVLVPQACLGGGNKFKLTFTPQDPCSPQELGLYDDARSLGIALSSVSVSMLSDQNNGIEI